MKGYESFSLEDLKLVYRVLHGQLTQQMELMDSSFFEGLQAYLQAEATRQGVELCDHSAWDAWLGGDVTPCEVRMENRFVVQGSTPGSGQDETA